MTINSLTKYWRILKITTQTTLEYRFDFVVRVVKYGLAISMMALVWLAVQAEKPVAGLTPQTTVQYFFLAAILYGLSNFHTWYVENDIKLGQLSKFLTKPIAVFNFYLFRQLSHSFWDVLVKTMIMIPLLYFFGLGLKFEWWQVAVFLIYLPLIFFFSFCVQFAVASGAFWVQEVYSLRWTSLMLSRFLAGIIIPLHLISHQFVAITYWLPFQHLAYTPIRFMQNQISLTKTLLGLAILGGWSIIAWGAAMIIWQRGSHHYESIGI